MRKMRAPQIAFAQRAEVFTAENGCSVSRSAAARVSHPAPPVLDCPYPLAQHHSGQISLVGRSVEEHEPVAVGMTREHEGRLHAPPFLE
jgi:hypothetical protein